MLRLGGPAWAGPAREPCGLTIRPRSLVSVVYPQDPRAGPFCSAATVHRAPVSIERSLSQAGGCLLSRDLVHSRSDARELAALVSTGVVLRLGRGAYALPAAPPDVVAPRLAGGLLTCVSAAAEVGLPLLRAPSAPHVAIPSTRRLPRSASLPPGTRVHWDGRVEAPAPGTMSALATPTPLALLHTLGCLPAREVVALWDAAVNRGVVRHHELAVLRPRRAGRRQFDAVLRSTDGRSQSMPETFLRLATRRLGLLVEPQALVEGIGFVDLLVERRVAVEVDGYAFHSDRVAFAEDRRRDRAALAVGLASLRYTFRDAVQHTERAAMEVLEAVRASVRSGRPELDERLVAVRAAALGPRATF